MNLVLDARTFQVVNGRTIMTGLNGDFPIGLSVQFKDGVFETNDKKIISALKKHPRYGVTFFSEALADELKEGEVKINQESLEEQREREALTEKVGSTCEWCGFPAANRSGLQLHQKSCDRKPK